MSSANRTGSVSEISPRHSFLRKILMCSYEKPTVFSETNINIGTQGVQELFFVNCKVSGYEIGE